MPPLSEIAAIVLAAGLSLRFEAGPEETKLVIPLFGKPLVRHVAEAALASRAGLRLARQWPSVASDTFARR